VAEAHSIVDVFLRYGVPHRVDAGRGGWVSTTCPYCVGSEDDYLGFSIEKSYFHCWSCGWRPSIDTLVLLCHVDRDTARDIYGSIRPGAGGPARSTRDRKVQAKVRLSLYRHPSGVSSMSPHHLCYLARRGFDPNKIAGEWGVLGTGPTAYLDGIDYRFRLLIPVTWDGAEVSFQTRDVTGKSDRKYLACPTDREIKHHKHILYGRQESWGETGIVVEGVTDVWRLGPRACAVFGIQYTTEQMLEIAKNFRRVAIVFDSDRAARAQARKLAAQLRLHLVTMPVVVDLGNGVDPGSLSQDDADHLVKELTR
jgi:hypothetical protein